jgi:HPt (histidine-containing phosphotransfer) domain-containing protein
MADVELDELRRQFLAEAQEKVRQMQDALDDDGAPDALDRLAYLAHQLKGSGGSYGYQTISTDAAEIEKAAESLTGSGTDTGLQDKLRQYVSSLSSEIDLRAREIGA